MRRYRSPEYWNPLKGHIDTYGLIMEWKHDAIAKGGSPSACRSLSESRNSMYGVPYGLDVQMP